MSSKRIYIGTVPAVFLKLLDQKAHAFTAEEEFVLDALRRSDKELTNAGVAQLSDYIAAYSPDQLKGIANNVKGIYHELRYVGAENSDSDEIEAELYELTNYPGADVRLKNVETGEVTDIQLKATGSIDYVQEHLEKYPDIDVVATKEATDSVAGVRSSGMRNDELSSEVKSTLDKLSNDDSYVQTSVGASGLVSGVLNAKLALSGGQSSTAATRKALEDMGVAGVSAAVIEILIG